MVKKYWLLTLKQEYSDKSLISDWYVLPKRFESLMELIDWFGSYGRKPVLLNAESMELRTDRDGIFSYGKASFVQEDEANAEDYQPLIERRKVVAV